MKEIGCCFLGVNLVEKIVMSDWFDGLVFIEESFQVKGFLVIRNAKSVFLIKATQVAFVVIASSYEWLVLVYVKRF